MLVVRDHTRYAVRQRSFKQTRSLYVKQLQRLRFDTGIQSSIGVARVDDDDDFYSVLLLYDEDLGGYAADKR